MSLSTAEIESLRFHLGYGQVAIANPYTPDGFLEVFAQVVAPNLGTGTETTASTAVIAGSSTTITPVSMADIVVSAQLVVDVGEACEIVWVRSVTSTTFTAAFTLAHPASGYPVLVMSGKARLRFLLGVCDRLWQKMQSPDVSDSLGIKQLGRGEIEWFGTTAVYDALSTQYLSTVNQLSSVVRVPVNEDTRSPRRSGSDDLEAY